MHNVMINDQKIIGKKLCYRVTVNGCFKGLAIKILVYVEFAHPFNRFKF